MSCIDDVKTTNKQAKSQQLASMTILNVNYLINRKQFFQPRTLAHLMILMLLLLMRFFQPRTSSWCQPQNCRGSTGCLTAPPKDSRCDLSDERSLSNKTSVHSLCVNRVLRGFVESIEIKSWTPNHKAKFDGSKIDENSRSSWLTAVASSAETCDSASSSPSAVAAFFDFLAFWDPSTGVDGRFVWRPANE